VFSPPQAMDRTSRSVSARMLRRGCKWGAV
jgi:hypothetical protein